jgi:hypothetical protein
LIALFSSNLEARSIFLVSVGVVMITTLIALADLAKVKSFRQGPNTEASRKPSKVSTQTME